MNRIKQKTQKRRNIKARVRKKISGCAVRPRLTVFRSNLHFYAQAIDDENGVTLASASTVEKAGRELTSKADQAKYVGESIATRLSEKGLNELVFDRSGYAYHGNVKLFADTVREKGLKI